MLITTPQQQQQQKKTNQKNPHPHLQREHEMPMLPLQTQWLPVEPLVSQNFASGPEMKSHPLRNLPVAKGRDNIKAAARWRPTTGANICVFSAAAAKSLQSCPTLCDPIDSSPPGSPVPQIAYSCPRTEEPSGLQYTGLQRVGPD